MAEKLADSILSVWPGITVKIKVAKPEVPIKGSVLAGAAVEIIRHR